MNDYISGRFLSTPQAEFYMPENGDWIAFGWIGGWMNTFPMLALGDAERLERVSQTFDFGLKAQEPSGYFHYAIRQDGNTSFREPKPDMNLTRTHGDVLFWMIKQFLLLKAQDRAQAIKPAWEAAMKKLADALVTTWRNNGQWGKMVNVKTGDAAWLEKSRNLANLAATWTVSYDYELPKFTALGALGTKFAGAVWASTQNKHAAPGYCTGSGDALLKIYRATGDARYAELIRDILHAHADAIHGGGGTERLTYCDADSRGENPPGCNGWVATNGAMMALEIPGIYLRTDLPRCYIFDSVEAKVTRRDATGVTLEIKNPTQFDAQVSVFAENAAQAAKPQGDTAFLKWPKVPVKAASTVNVSIKPDGAIRPN